MEIWGRLGFERLPTFCYECGVLGRAYIDCDKRVEGVDSSEHI